MKTYSIPSHDSRHPSSSSSRAKQKRRFVVLTICALLAGRTLFADETIPIDLGAAVDFGALAGAAISGTGDVHGDVGSGTGGIAPAITSTGTIYPTGHAVVMTALEDFASAYNEGKNRAHDILLSAAAYELGGSTLTPGVYKIGGAATLATALTLDAEGDPNGVFIFQIAGALGATASVGNVILINEAQSANVFWIVEGAVSMGASTHMEGTLLGGAAIAFGAATTLNGRAMAGFAAGTLALDTTTISVPVEPAFLGDRVWFDANGNGLQDTDETTGIPAVPVTLLQVVLESLTIDLGTAAHFGALAGAAISGTGHVDGDVGSGTGAIAPAITSSETIYPTGHAVVMTALTDFTAAYNNGKNRAHDVLLSAAAYELGGSTLTPGVYKIGGAATVATPLTLDAQGDPEAVFILQITGALGTTASVGNVVLVNDAKSANVFWIVEGAVSMGAGSHMEGNILGGAAIAFGATTTISGRVMAGFAAGTIALADTTISAVSGYPPVGNPPPIAVADTVTDANGNYLFAGVQPGTYIVRWDLTDVTNTLRITTAKLGNNDALDSDGVSGDVGEFVYSMEMVVLAGTTNLHVDLGLLETLPSIKAAALDELITALAIYLEANYYTEENWTALKTARADGELEILAASDAAGVAAAMDAALAAMDAVPTFAETLAASKTFALDELATALETYLESDYSAENWALLNNAWMDGELAILTASDPAGVATAKNDALVAMDAVPTIAETLTAAKVAALHDLAVALAIYLEENYYTSENWAALITAKTDGDTAIDAATDLEGVAAAMDAALATMDALLTLAETLMFTEISRTPEGDVTLVLRTIPNYLVTLQTSTDLEMWSTIATATPSSEVWTFVHNATLATGTNRFYQAFLLP